MEYTDEMFELEQEEELVEEEPDFGEEEVILGVIDLQGMFCPEEEEDDITASFQFMIWKEEGTDEVHEEKVTLFKKVNESAYKELKKVVMKTAMVRCRVRRSLRDSTLFLLVGKPQKAEDEELENKKRELQEYEAEGLGVMVLDDSWEWFETKLDWNELLIDVVLEKSEKENVDMQAQIAREVFENLSEWEEQARSLAADVLLEVKNTEYLEAEEGEEAMEKVNRKTFLSYPVLECVQVFCDGVFALWFNDGDLFFGHQILVSGDLKQGLQDAELV